MSRHGEAGGRDSEDGEGPLKFEWHPLKAASNLKKHKVSFPEASTVFSDKLRIEAPDQWHSDDEQRYLGIGRSMHGRILSVYFTFRAEKIRIISARLAERWERNAYETGDEQGRS